MYSILIIDDEESIVLMITMALARYGFNVEVATNSSDGLRIFDSGCFDLVITDIRMPGIDGNQVARHIRNSAKSSVPIIGMSGTPWLIESGDFDAVLAKPFSIKTLIHTVKYLTAAPLEAMTVK